MLESIAWDVEPRCSEGVQTTCILDMYVAPVFGHGTAQVQQAKMRNESDLLCRLDPPAAAASRGEELHHTRPHLEVSHSHQPERNEAVMSLDV